jgi:hypothetical protein
MKKTPANPFQPGNTFGRGRPQGSRNKATVALQEMLDGHGESITRKCALLALQGNPTALRLCMERLIAPRKEHAVKFKQRPISTAAEVAAAVDAVFDEVAAGHLTPSEGQMVVAMLEGRLRIIQAVDHENRLSALESDADAKIDPSLIFIPKDPE